MDEYEKKNPTLNQYKGCHKQARNIVRRSKNALCLEEARKQQNPWKKSVE